MKRINWKKLAREVGALSDHNEIGGTEFARAALARIIGDAEIVGAVHAAIDFEPGAELALNVLTLLRPHAAMQECYRIFSESSDLEERQLAVSTLASIADHTVLEWLDEFLDDPDSIIQSWGAKVMQELVYEHLVDEEEIEKWLVKCERHSNVHVREMAANARRTLNLEQESAESSGASDIEGSC